MTSRTKQSAATLSRGRGSRPRTSTRWPGRGCAFTARTSAAGACRRGPRSSRAITLTPSSPCGCRGAIPAAPTTPGSARSGRRCSASTATTRPTSASGTPAPTPGSAATGTTRSCGIGPSTRTMPGRITRNSCSPSTARRSGRTATRRTTTRSGPSTTSRAPTGTGASHGFYGCATAASMGPRSPRRGTGGCTELPGWPHRPTSSAPGPANRTT
jgi:hypothetical protein